MIVQVIVASMTFATILAVTSGTAGTVGLTRAQAGENIFLSRYVLLSSLKVNLFAHPCELKHELCVLYE